MWKYRWTRRITSYRSLFLKIWFLLKREIVWHMPPLIGNVTFVWFSFCFFGFNCFPEVKICPEAVQAIKASIFAFAAQVINLLSYVPLPLFLLKFCILSTVLYHTTSQFVILAKNSWSTIFVFLFCLSIFERKCSSFLCLSSWVVIIFFFLRTVVVAFITLFPLAMWSFGWLNFSKKKKKNHLEFRILNYNIYFCLSFNVM